MYFYWSGCGNHGSGDTGYKMTKRSKIVIQYTQKVGRKDGEMMIMMNKKNVLCEEKEGICLQI